MSQVYLDVRARKLIDTEAHRWRLRETGGGLFGWECDEGVFIACVSGPGDGAEHGLRSFTPTKLAVAASMRLVATASEARYGYLGTWHTHPRGDAVPSAIDARTARGMAGQATLGLPRPVMLILATTGRKRRVRPRELRAWRWNCPTGSLEPVVLTEVAFRERYCPAAELLFA